MMKEKKSLAKEFKTFISRGNVIDLSVGIIIGSAFTGIVNSLVKEVIMPPIGLIIGKVNFADLKFVLQPASIDITGKVMPEVAIMYGSLLQSLLNFLIVALVVFSLVKVINSLQKKEEKTEKKEKVTELSVLKEISKGIKRLKNKG